MSNNQKFFKKFFALMIVISMFVSVTPIYAEGTDSGGERSFYLIHNNDTHARTVGDSITAGLANMLEANEENYAVLHAGDAFQGQAISSITDGAAIADIMNQVGYDYLVPGNHEFDFGFDRLLEFEKMSNYTFISSNIFYKDTNELVFKDSDIVEYNNGLKVGFFGLTTPETATKTTPAYVESLTFADPVLIAKQMVEKLQKEDCDIIIALTHLGVDASSGVTSEIVANSVDGIDVMVDGHSHTVMENGLKVNDTLIVQTGEYYSNIGLTKIIVDKDGNVSFSEKLISTDLEKNPIDNEALASFNASKEVADYITKVNKESETIINQVVGTIDFDLNGVREDVRTKETNLSSTIASSILKGSNADIAFMNGGGIRASIESGDITMGELITVLPFGNAIISKDILGVDIVTAIEHGVSSLPETAGQFPHLAGVNVSIDPTAPAGSRVTSISMEDGSEFDLNKTYTVGFNEFMGAGGDGYTMFTKYPVKMYYNTDADMFIDYVNEKGMIYTEPAGRLVQEEAKSPAEIEKVVADEEKNTTNVVEVVETTEIVEATEIAEVTEATEVVEEPVVASVPTYTVKSGDCLYLIGLNHNIAWQEIAKINKISSPYIIYPKQTLNLK